MLNHPVYQAHPRLFFLARRPAQKYRPPAVGKREQTSAIPRATASTKIPTIGQPRLIADGPPEFSAMEYEVMQPARIEMIENDTAKLEKPDMRRRSSCL